MSRETAVGVGATSLAVLAMAVDHLLGDDPGLEDPPVFGISVGLSLALAALLFAWVVPRARRPDASPQSVARWAVGCSLLAAVLVPPALWLGVPLVLAGAGVALGLVCRDLGRRRAATAALLVGAAAVTLGAAAYAYVAVDKLL